MRPSFAEPLAALVVVALSLWSVVTDEREVDIRLQATGLRENELDCFRHRHHRLFGYTTAKLRAKRAQCNAAMLVDAGGRVGLGEWRPERSGTFGQYRYERVIIEPAELDDIRKQCEVPLVTHKIPQWAIDASLAARTPIDDLKQAFDGTKAGAQHGLDKAKKTKKEKETAS